MVELSNALTYILLINVSGILKIIDINAEWDRNVEGISDFVCVSGHVIPKHTTFVFQVMWFASILSANLCGLVPLLVHDTLWFISVYFLLEHIANQELQVGGYHYLQKVSEDLGNRWCDFFHPLLDDPRFLSPHPHHTHMIYFNPPPFHQTCSPANISIYMLARFTDSFYNDQNSV